MAESKLLTSSTIRRSRWLALPAVLVTLGGVLFWWLRNPNRPAPEVEPLPSPRSQPLDTPVVEVSPAPPPTAPQSRLRWLLYIGGTMFVACLLIILSGDNPELSAASFMLVLMASVVYLLFISAGRIGHGLQHVQQSSGYLEALRARVGTLVSFGSGSIAVFLAVSSAVLFWYIRSYENLRDQAALMFIFSVMFVFLALLLYPQQGYTRLWMTITASVPAYAARGWRPGMSLFLQRTRTRLALFTGILLLVVVTEINGQFLKSSLARAATVQFQFLVLVVGTVLVVIGLTGVRSRSIQPALSWRARLLPYWPLALITVVAFVLRFWQLDIGMRFLVDERSFIDGTREIRLYPFTGLLQPFSSISAFPYVFPYFQTVSFGIFGNNLFALRIPSAVLGTLGIPAIYFLARTLFDRKVALLAALILATFPPHLQFSRIAICEIASPFFATIGFALLARGMQKGDRRDFVISGVMFGFTHYFHEGGRLLYTPLALLWIVGCIVLMPAAEESASSSLFKNIGARVKGIRSGMGGWFAGLVLIAAPIYFTLIGINRPLFARLVDNSSGLTSNYWQDLLLSRFGLINHINEHVIPAFSVYFYQRDSTLFYSQTTALLLTGTLIVVMLGFAVACFHWRKPSMMLLIIWVLATAMGNSLMKDSTGSPRFVMVFPALALVAAVGIRYIVPIFVRREKWQLRAMAVIGIVLALYQTNFYFNVHLPEFGQAFRHANGAPDGYDAAYRSINFPLNTQVHLVSKPVFNQIEAEGLIWVWRSDISVDSMVPDRVIPSYLKELACGVDHAFYVQKQDEAMLKILDRFFKLSPPQYTTYDDLDVSERYVLYYAAYDPNDGSIYSRLCSGQPAYDE